MKKAYLKKKTTLMIDTNSDPNENGMQIANTASHQSDLGRVHDKQKYTTTNRNTKKVEKTQQKKIVINPFFFLQICQSIRLWQITTEKAIANAQ